MEITEIDSDLLASQDRLLKKRVMLNQTENPGPMTANTDFTEIAARCMAVKKQENIARVEEICDQLCRLRVDGVPKLYGGCTFENFIGNEKLIDDLKGLLTSPDNIVLRGNTGCGKTHLAIAMAKQIPSKVISTRLNIILGSVFITVPELLLKIRSSFRDSTTETEEQLIDYYTSCEVLILDDLGSEKSSEYSITTLYIILDRRISQVKRTIITTNLSQSEIEQTLGSRVASRLAGMVNIKINMPDYRKKR